jgi:hypothetical protein
MKASVLLILFFISTVTKAQLYVTNGGTPQQIVDEFIGNGLSVSNITMNCGPNSGTAAYGIFNGTTSNIGLGYGSILSTGNAALAQGPNNSGSSGYCWQSGPMPVDPDLYQINPFANYDLCVLEFDVIPTCSNMTLKFVFGSEEYPEYVNSNVSDAFGLFLTGPGPDCSSSYVNYNIARLPGGTQITIDSINAGYYGGCPTSQTGCVNCAYYVNNCGGTTVQYDGFTIPITVNIAVCPCATYHFKFAIADAGDCVWDSGVLIETLQCTSTLAYNVSTADALCGCDGSASVNITGGTPPFTYSWSPSSQTGQTATGLCAGSHTVTVTDSASCSVPVTQVFTISGVAALTLSDSIINASCSSCNDGTIILNASGGTPGYSYSINPAAGIPSGNTFTNVPPGLYVACVTDTNNCSVCDTVEVLFSTGFQSTFALQGMFLYPNPVRDRFIINTTGELEIYDVTGRLVERQMLNRKQEIINCKLNAGIYLVQVKDGEKVFTGKLVVE